MTMAATDLALAASLALAGALRRSALERGMAFSKAIVTLHRRRWTILALALAYSSFTKGAKPVVLGDAWRGAGCNHGSADSVHGSGGGATGS